MGLDIYIYIAATTTRGMERNSPIMSGLLSRLSCRGCRLAGMAVLLVTSCLLGCGGGSQAGKETDAKTIEQRRQEAEKMSQREHQNQ